MQQAGQATLCQAAALLAVGRQELQERAWQGQGTGRLVVYVSAILLSRSSLYFFCISW